MLLLRMAPEFVADQKPFTCALTGLHRGPVVGLQFRKSAPVALGESGKIGCIHGLHYRSSDRARLGRKDAFSSSTLQLAASDLGRFLVRFGKALGPKELLGEMTDEAEELGRMSPRRRSQTMAVTPFEFLKHIGEIP